MDPLQNRTPRQLAEAIVDLDANVEEQVLIKLEALRLRHRLERLPQLEWRVLRWRFGLAGGERLSRRKISLKLGLPISRVRGIEQHALTLLRASEEEVAA